VTSQPASSPLQVCRDCGGGAPVDAHFCPQCTKILTISRHGDYFRFFGLPRKLNISASDLDQRFRGLSRQFHPDYFVNAPPAERRASLERSSYLNDAYRTLKQPISRVEYLLQLEGFIASGPGRGEGAPGMNEAASKPVVPPSLLEEVFALNEELDEIRDLRASGASADALKARLERARGPIDEKRTAHEAQLEELSGKWDALLERGARESEYRPVLEALRERVLERNYINNLLAGIEREMSQPGGSGPRGEDV
jgi:molecular chaperone HscB